MNIFLGILPVILLVYRHVLRVGRFKIRATPELMIVIPIFIGTTLRTLYLSGVFSVDETSVQELLFGLTNDDIFISLVLTNLAILTYFMGSLVENRGRSVDKMKSYVINRRKLVLGIVLFYIISIYALLQLLKSFDLQSLILSEISGKKRIIGDDGIRMSFGYYRFFTSFSLYGALLSYSRVNADRAWRGLFLLLSIIGFGLVLIVSIVASSRTELLTLVAVIVLLQFSYERFKVNRTIIYGIILLTLSTSILNYRHSATQGVNDKGYVEAIVGNHNMLGVVKLGLIVDRMDGFADYKYGLTYFNWLFAPIPRSVWPEKPAVSIGLVMRKEIMPLNSGDNSSGIPPSFFAESYWNFGIFGLLLFPFIWGMLLSRAYRRIFFTPVVYGSPTTLVLNLYIYWNFSFRLAAEDFSYIMVDTLKVIIAYYIFQKMILVTKTTAPYE